MEMIIDIGNTNQKIAIFDHDIMLEMNLFRKIGINQIKNINTKYRQIHHCILSSVVNRDKPLVEYLSANSGLLVLDENTPVPVRNLYQTPSTLGKDRLAAAVAGHSHFPGSDVLVINAGTCITYDFVSSRGEYLGGAISPGFRMRYKALNTFTGKLPLLEFVDNDTLIGTDTQLSIHSGVFNGVISEIEGVITRYQERFPGLKTIVSGGDLNYFDKRLKISTFAVPNIVIHGLYQILAFNVSQTC